MKRNYDHNYSNIDRSNSYNKDKKDYSWIIVMSIFIAPLCVLILFGLAVKISDSNRANMEKDKLIEVERNSIGCIKYRFNSDIVWKCPKEHEITQIEREVCYGAGKHRSCDIVYDPVVSK